MEPLGFFQKLNWLNLNLGVLSSTLILALSSPASLLKFMGETAHFLKVLRTVEGSGRSRGFTQVQIHSVFKLRL